MSEELKGLIFDLQRFSINDGPGIRTTLFFKGCALRCPWCHNPESISMRIQLNHDKNKCTLCKKCVDMVNGKGIRVKDGAISIDFDSIEDEEKLIDICPNGAYDLCGRYVTADELLKEIVKDKAYYENSSGGVTFSGGEAILQIEFLEKLSEKLKSENISIALDFSGYDPNNNLARTIDFTDIYLLDYKWTGSEIQNIVGKNIDIIKVLDILNENQKDVILRCPIIPEMNDNEEHFKAIAKLSRQYKCIMEVNILPYHSMKKSKQFKRIIEDKTYRVPEIEDKMKWKQILSDNGLKNGIMENEKI